MNRPSRTRDRILGATVKLVRQHGMRGATTLAIAKEAGVNEVTLFRHFQNKETLLKAAFAAATYAPAVTQAIRDQATGVLTDDLITFAKAYLQLLRENADFIMISLREPEFAQTLGSEIASIPAEIKQALIEYFSRMQSEGKIIATDLESQALSFIWIVFGYFQASLKHGQLITALSEDVFLHHSMTVFARGLTP